MLSVRLRFTDSDYPFGIFKVFLASGLVFQSCSPLSFQCKLVRHIRPSGFKITRTETNRWNTHTKKQQQVKVISSSTSERIIFWKVCLVPSKYNKSNRIQCGLQYNKKSYYTEKTTSHKTVDLHVIIVSIIDIHWNVNVELYSTAMYCVIVNLPRI